MKMRVEVVLLGAGLCAGTPGVSGQEIDKQKQSFSRSVLEWREKEYQIAQQYFREARIRKDDLDLALFNLEEARYYLARDENRPATELLEIHSRLLAHHQALLESLQRWELAGRVYAHEVSTQRLKVAQELHRQELFKRAIFQADEADRMQGLHLRRAASLQAVADSRKTAAEARRRAIKWPL
jgi:hypothetical protein